MGAVQDHCCPVGETSEPFVRFEPLHLCLLTFWLSKDFPHGKTLEISTTLRAQPFSRQWLIFPVLEVLGSCDDLGA